MVVCLLMHFIPRAINSAWCVIIAGYKSKWHAFNLGSPRNPPRKRRTAPADDRQENRPSLMHTALYLFGYKRPSVLDPYAYPNPMFISIDLSDSADTVFDYFPRPSDSSSIYIVRLRRLLEVKSLNHAFFSFFFLYTKEARIVGTFTLQLNCYLNILKMYY